MFTGIIEEVGSIENIAIEKDIHKYQIQASSEFIRGVQKGDSIAVNGVCLTAYEILTNSFYVDVSEETQKCTSFGQITKNKQVNLERAVTPSTRMGGHFVSGHVDGLGSLTRRDDKENETVLWIQLPSELVKYVAVKGSICIDGVSLTVNDADGEQCCITIIPHTLSHTTLASIKVQDRVNIEVDLVARYLEQIINNK